MTPSADTLQFFGIIVTALGALAGIYLSTHRSEKRDKVDTAQGLIDQLQEERDQLVTRMDNHQRECRDEIAQLRDEVARFRREHMGILDYAQMLRNHIRDDKGPPPPDWPEWMLMQP